MWMLSSPNTLGRLICVLERHLEKSNWEVFVHFRCDPKPIVRDLWFLPIDLYKNVQPEIGVSAADPLHHGLHQLLAEVQQEVAVLKGGW